MKQQHQEPSLLDSLTPIILLVILLFSSVLIFGNDSSGGPNQIALLLAMGVTALIGLKNGFKWKDIESGIIQGISVSLGAILILLAVGSLIGTWLLSGTVPTLIYFGLQLLNPALFYTAASIICAVVAMSIGSSWTTAATVGVALMGVANGMEMSEGIAAGAIVSGAYFGDKISPLSETTNLAPAVVGTDLFEHIRYMLWTVIPSMVLSLVLFTVIGLNSASDVSSDHINEIQSLLMQEFNIGWPMLIPLVILLIMAINKVPAFPAVSIGALLGGVWALIFQPDVIAKLSETNELVPLGGLTVVWQTFYQGVSFSTGNAELDDLLSGGGMANMLNTIWLIMCALTFGSVLEKVGLLKRAVGVILKGAKSAGDMVTRTILTCFGTNLITADQYISIIMPGRMYKEEFEKRGLHQLNLSRSLEDGGTLTSPLIPWNTCGAYMHSVLAVHPFEYALYAFFNLINPLLSILYAFIGIKILRVTPPSSTPTSSAETDNRS